MDSRNRREPVPDPPPTMAIGRTIQGGGAWVVRGARRGLLRVQEVVILVLLLRGAVPVAPAHRRLKGKRPKKTVGGRRWESSNPKSLIAEKNAKGCFAELSMSVATMGGGEDHDTT